MDTTIVCRAFFFFSPYKMLQSTNEPTGGPLCLSLSTAFLPHLCAFVYRVLVRRVFECKIYNARRYVHHSTAAPQHNSTTVTVIYLFYSVVVFFSVSLGSHSSVARLCTILERRAFGSSVCVCTSNTKKNISAYEPFRMNAGMWSARGVCVSVCMQFALSRIMFTVLMHVYCIRSSGAKRYNRGHASGNTQKIKNQNEIMCARCVRFGCLCSWSNIFIYLFNCYGGVCDPFTQYIYMATLCASATHYVYVLWCVCVGSLLKPCYSYSKSRVL